MRRLAPFALVLLAACGTSRQSEQLREAVRTDPPTPPPPSVAFRFANERAADVRPYQLPRLNDVDWRFRTPGLVAQRALGAGAADDRVWVLTPAQELVALDLETGRARVWDSLIVFAALDPRGVPMVVSRDGTVRRWRGRSARVMADSLPGTVEYLHGTVGGKVLAITRQGDTRLYRELEAGGRLPEGTPIPDGPVAFTPWGDAVVVASDTGLWVRERNVRDGDRFLEDDPAQAVAWSGSAHRLYVARGTAIEILERYDLASLGTIRLPAEPLALRTDPWGRFLMARYPHGDSLWIVSLEETRAPVLVPGSWDDELPAAAPDGTVLSRAGRDVVAWERDGTERGRVAGAGADHWTVAAWDARRPTLQLAAEPAAPSDPSVNRRLYVQVSSTSNQDWAEDLATDLRQAGVRASVFAPTAFGDMYRVVVGPFASREEAEATGRMLGMPFWIFTPEGGPDGQ